jgi:hypothetical protein
LCDRASPLGSRLPCLSAAVLRQCPITIGHHLHQALFPSSIPPHSGAYKANTPFPDSIFSVTSQLESPPLFPDEASVSLLHSYSSFKIFFAATKANSPPCISAQEATTPVTGASLNSLPPPVDSGKPCPRPLTYKMGPPPPLSAHSVVASLVRRRQRRCGRAGVTADARAGGSATPGRSPWGKRPQPLGQEAARPSGGWSACRIQPDRSRLLFFIFVIPFKLQDLFHTSKIPIKS